MAASKMTVVYHEAFTGRALPILRMLAEAKIDYDWKMDDAVFSCKGAETTTFACPAIIDGELKISQSLSCTMYAGKKCGFDTGVNDCVATQYMLDAADMMAELSKNKSTMVDLKKFLEGDRFKAWMGNIERSIQGPFYFGADKSYVDFWLAGVFEMLDAMVFGPLGDKVTAVLAPYTKVAGVKASILGLSSFTVAKAPLPPSMLLSAAKVAEYGAAAKRVLMVLTSHDKLGATEEQTGWYLPEVAHPHKVFTEAGLKLTYASIKGGVAPLDESSIAASPDADSQAFFKNEASMKLTKETIKIEDAKAEDYDAIFYAGGFGTMWDFPDSAASAKLAGAIYDNGGIVSAVCHGPSALVNIKLKDGSLLVKDKQVTAFTNAEEDAVKRRDVVPFTCEDKLTEQGATFVHRGVFQPCVVESGRLITGQNPPSSEALAHAIVKALKA